MSVVGDLVHGCIDLHVHMSPDPHGERRFDAIQLAVAAREAGMGGVVMKSHSYPTAPIVYAASQIVKEIGLFGSLVLNKEVGGINPDAAEVSGRLGAKIVWMPTSSAKSSRIAARHGGKGISVFDENGRLIPAVYDVLDVIRQFDMALGTGHLGREESFAVIDAAREKGIRKIIYTHAMSTVAGPLSVEEQIEAVRRGAVIEHCALSLMPSFERQAPEAMAEAIKATSPAHCVVSTDFGQAGNPSPPEGMRLVISLLLQCGIGQSEVELMVKTNPAQLLGLR